MTTCFRLPMASSPFTRYSPSPSPSLHRQAFKPRCSISRTNARFPMPPRDRFPGFTNSPEDHLHRPSDDIVLPYSEVDFTNPMGFHPNLEHLSRRSSMNEKPQASDLASALLNERIVYIGLPFVDPVVEQIYKEFLHLFYLDREMPIYIYINSTGCSRDDGVPVADDLSAYALYDAMMFMQDYTDIYTVGIGFATNEACLLLAAGTKGKRFMFPRCQAMIQETTTADTGEMRATDILANAKEILDRRDQLIEILALHTGNSKERIRNAIKHGPYYMDAEAAIEFGIVDKIYSPNRKMKNSGTFAPEESQPEPESESESVKEAGVPT